MFSEDGEIMFSLIHRTSRFENLKLIGSYFSSTFKTFSHFPSLPPPLPTDFILYIDYFSNRGKVVLLPYFTPFYVP